MSNRPHRCKQCRRTDEEVGHISARRLCEGCASENMLANQRAMREQSGPLWEEWRRRWLATPGPYGRPITPYDVPSE